jgi:ABC-type multidrug transport system fused ATPase/permease subunit
MSLSPGIRLRLPQIIEHWRFFRRMRVMRRREALLVLGLSTVTVIAETGGMAMILPVLSFVEQGRDVAVFRQSSQFAEILVSIYERLSLPVNLPSLSAVAFLLICLRQFINYFNFIELERIKWNIGRRLCTRVFEAILGSKASNIATFKAGDFGLIADYECQGTAALARIYGTIWMQILSFLAYGSVLLWTAPVASLIAGFVIGVSMLSLRFILKKAKRLSNIALDIRHQYGNFLNERFRAWKLIKLGNTLAVETERAVSIQARVVSNQVHTAQTSGISGLVLVPTISFILLATLYAFVEVFHLNIATIVLFILVMIRLAPVSQALQRQWVLLTQYSPSLDRTRDVLKDAVLHVERLDVGAPITGLEREIRFERVTFSYPERAVPALSDVSIAIPARRLTALVGRSGAGKSTLVDLIPRLIDTSEGRILLDGMDIKSISLRTLRGAVSYVPQQPFLFDASVADNIRYCCPAASDEDVIEAAQKANAHDFISEMPDGYGTLLGDGGAKLSGGQKQRIVLARAFLTKAQILILDEPTSGKRRFRRLSSIWRASTPLRSSSLLIACPRCETPTLSFIWKAVVSAAQAQRLKCLLRCSSPHMRWSLALRRVQQRDCYGW